MPLRLFLVFCYSFVFISCAASDDVFPSVVLDTEEALVQLPNPIDLVVDEVNSQVLVANSNVDIFYDGGSLAVLSFDATEPAAPQLAAVKIIETPNFAGEMFFDGVSAVYLSFREASSSNEQQDQLHHYSFGAGDVTFVSQVNACSNPFGIAGDSASDRIYVVCDDVLEVYNFDLELLDTLDLTTVEETLESTNAQYVEKLVLDSVNNRLFVSNLDGSIFVINTINNTLDQVISGPLSTRDLILDGNFLYALDGLSRAVWVFDVSQLPAVGTAPESVDDSQILVTTITVGNDPNGMALDSTGQRLYVANSFDDTISVLDVLTYQEITRVSVDQEDISSVFLRDGREPRDLALGTFNGTTFLFIASYGNNNILVMDTSTLNVVEMFPNRLEDE